MAPRAVSRVMDMGLLWRGRGEGAQKHREPPSAQAVATLAAQQAITISSFERVPVVVGCGQMRSGVGGGAWTQSEVVITISPQNGLM